MPSKFLYVQYTDLGRRSHVCLHSPESCFLRQKKFICLGGKNLACEMMIRRFIRVKREKTRSDPKGATGADPGFFLGGGALVSCSTSTPINHIFFWQNTSCIRKPQVISGGGGVRTPAPSP